MFFVPLAKEMESWQIRRTSRGMRLIDGKGYTYTKDRHVGSKSYWRCDYRPWKCKARASLIGAAIQGDYSKAHVMFNLMTHGHGPTLKRKVKTGNDGENETAEDSQPSKPLLKISPPKKSPNKSSSSSTTNTTAVLNPPSSPESEMCLRWNSHHANMSTVIPALMDDERYVDVTLVAEGSFIKCHKLILSSCSNYFNEMLQNTNSSQQTIIFLRDIQHWQIKALVDFMYKGEVNVDQSKLESLLKAAEDLQIKGLAGNTPKKEPEVLEPPTIIEKIEKTPIPEIKTENEKYLDNVIMEEDDDDEEYFPPPEKRGKYKKKDRKRKISAPPDPSQLKHVKINLRGTKSRPNIKQPKFFSPDYPEYDPDRCVSPPKLDTDPLFHIDNIKLEPIDIEVPKSPTFFEMNSLMDKSLSENMSPKKKEIKVYTKTKISDEKQDEKPSTSKDALENPYIEKIILPGQKEVLINNKAIIVKCQNVKKIIDENSSIQKMLEAATGKPTLSESDKAKLPQIRVRNLPTTETMLKKFATTQLTSILKKGEAGPGPAPKHIILKKVPGSTKPTILRHSLPAKTKEFTTEVQETEDIAEKISLLAKTRKELNTTTGDTTKIKEETIEEASATKTEKQTNEETTD